jgi:hypothetical protein
MHFLTRRLSPSAAIAFVALFIALCGGTALAQDVLITSSSQIKDGVVQLNDLGQPVVAAGVSKGVGTSTNPFLINPTNDVQSVELADPILARYEVRFSKPIRHCQWAATQARISGSVQPTGAFFQVEPSKTETDVVNVYTKRLVSGNTDPEPISFYLLGRC